MHYEGVHVQDVAKSEKRGARQYDCVSFTAPMHSVPPPFLLPLFSATTFLITFAMIHPSLGLISFSFRRLFFPSFLFFPSLPSSFHRTSLIFIPHNVFSDGKTTPFPVEIGSTKAIGDLKNTIKAKKTNELSDVDAYMLSLWRVSILVVPK